MSRRRGLPYKKWGHRPKTLFQHDPCALPPWRHAAFWHYSLHAFSFFFSRIFHFVHRRRRIAASSRTYIKSFILIVCESLCVCVLFVCLPALLFAFPLIPCKFYAFFCIFYSHLFSLHKFWCHFHGAQHAAGANIETHTRFSICHTKFVCVCVQTIYVYSFRLL